MLVRSQDWWERGIFLVTQAPLTSYAKHHFGIRQEWFWNLLKVGEIVRSYWMSRKVKYYMVAIYYWMGHIAFTTPTHHLPRTPRETYSFPPLFWPCIFCAAHSINMFPGIRPIRRLSFSFEIASGQSTLMTWGRNELTKTWSFRVKVTNE